MISSIPDAVAAVKALKGMWENTPPSWEGQDPCGDQWDGIKCINSRVNSIQLSSMGLKGQLSVYISDLQELQTIDLSYNKDLGGPLPTSIGSLKKLENLIMVGCGFFGPIPDSIGSLQQLVFLSLNSNKFSGQIPPSIGNLSQLFWLDLTDNKLEGPIPISTGTTPGLDMLIKTKHFHLGKNQLSGRIPPELFRPDMHLIHVLFDSNKLTGSIPSTLGLVQTLEVVRLDRNSLTGPVPSNLNNLTNVTGLSLSNNRLSGPLPNLTGMNILSYLDMSNNSFDASDFPPWISTLQSLTTLVMENTQLQGQIPTRFFSLPYLQTVDLSNNTLNGTLDIGTSYRDRLQLIDLRNNLIAEYSPIPGQKQVEVILVNNLVCKETGVSADYCTIPRPNSSNVSLPNNCEPIPCRSNQISSPKCKCAYPYTGLLVFIAPSFSVLDNKTNYILLVQQLMDSFSSKQLPVDSVSISNQRKDPFSYLELKLEVFPSNQDHFNRSVISQIAFVLSNANFNPTKPFGPYFFHGDSYQYFAGEATGSNNSLNTGIIIGAVAGGSALVLLLLLAGVYAYHQKKRAERATEQNNPFAHWDSTKSSGAGVPQLKGARCFSFEELKKYTSNFSEANNIGSGGYGKVYRGILPSGKLIAIKRAQQISLQGGLEFKTEIELLSRVHHKNLVSLLGFCFDQGEQMLIYEFVPNGSLRDSLSGKSGTRLDWIRRLKIALGSARGLAYLHELANPPIIHRDIKTTNILLDECLNAKVADFGLSKLMGDTEKGHVTTQVKGTMVSIGLETTLKGLNKFVDLALECVKESGADRPKMGEVVKEIEDILQLAGLNPNNESASTSASYEEAAKGSPSHPYSKDSFDYSGAFPPSKIEPQ
ncbi:hypothetical protein GH714_019757 [Hevea brasiliensis]|uniref:non-specific serine/threonine protein kinase n=1 Tax=Hevea brasiliensis TaxID=3981 RepID=A0A6A6MUS1_HEVBR|nr:hypothetical protein GH714_019757 [Hevea brasiliensis]